MYLRRGPCKKLARGKLKGHDILHLLDFFRRKALLDSISILVAGLYARQLCGARD